MRTALTATLTVGVVCLFAVSALAEGSSTGFSDTEMKVLPWLLFFVLSGICGGTAAKKG